MLSGTAQSKRCPQCGIEKPRSAFYAAKRPKSGLRSECKVCGNSNTSRYGREHRAYMADRQNVCYQKHIVERRLANREWKKRSGWVDERHKILARKAVCRALKTGKIIRNPCEVCEDTNVQAHHDDYTKQLDVRWLCAKHHGEAHRSPNETTN